MMSLPRVANVHRVGRARNASLAAMRRCCLLVLWAACSSDPSLALSIQHPDGYGVVQTTVTVYVSSDASCSKIALGDLDEGQLAAITVDEVDVTDGGGLELARLGSKTLVARGYDAQHRFVTAGCQDVGEIAGTTRVEIATQPTAVIAIDPSQPDRPFAERSILVEMRDVNGAVLDGMVGWQLTGPFGSPEQPPATGVATTSGQATIDVADLGVPGPEGLRIRVPWATAPLPLVTAFDLSRATTLALTPDGTPAATAGVHPSCDVRNHAGKPPTLICLNPPNVQGHRNVVEIAWSVDHYATTKYTLPVTIDDQFALFVDRDGSADEPVYIISRSTGGNGNWYKLGDAGNGTAMTFTNALQNVIYVPRCRGSSLPPLVGITTGTPLGNVVLAERREFFTVAGASNGDISDGEAFSGGCVVDTDNAEHQGVVVSAAAGDPALVLLEPGKRLIVATPKLSGSGFVAVSAQGNTEQRFTGARLQASGTVVFEAVLSAEADGYKLVERTELDAAAPPTRIVGGKLDRDGDTDLIWDMAAGARRRFFQASLARRVNGAPLTAMTSGPSGITATTSTDFAVGDFDANGVDEVVIYTPTAVTFYQPPGN